MEGRELVASNVPPPLSEVAVTLGKRVVATPKGRSLLFLWALGLFIMLAMPPPRTPHRPRTHAADSLRLRR